MLCAGVLTRGTVCGTVRSGTCTCYSTEGYSPVVQYGGVLMLGIGCGKVRRGTYAWYSTVGDSRVVQYGGVLTRATVRMGTRAWYRVCGRVCRCTYAWYRVWGKTQVPMMPYRTSVPVSRSGLGLSSGSYGHVIVSYCTDGQTFVT